MHHSSKEWLTTKRQQSENEAAVKVLAAQRQRSAVIPSAMLLASADRCRCVPARSLKGLTEGHFWNMKTWIVVQEFTGKLLPHIDGAKPNYGGFDFRVSKVDSEEVEIVAGCEDAWHWLPSIKAGIVQCCQELQGQGERFRGVKIEITRVYSRELDTTDEVMKWRGRRLLYELTTYSLKDSQLQSIEK